MDEREVLFENDVIQAECNADGRALNIANRPDYILITGFTVNYVDDDNCDTQEEFEIKLQKDCEGTILFLPKLIEFLKRC